jgi:shikimate dehydrogenase
VPAEVLPPEAAAWEQAARTCPLVVHTTSQGLQPDDVPLLTRRGFYPGQWIFDAVYTAHLTPILREASQAGARTLNGLGMLVHQGAESFRLWTGLEPDLAAMHAAVRG